MTLITESCLPKVNCQIPVGNVGNLTVSKETAYKVMKVEEFDDAVFYRVACGCGSRNHDFELWMEYDKELKYVTMSISQTMYWKHYYELYPWYERWFKRVCCSIKILFGGRIEMESDVLFSKKEHIESFIGALKVGLQHIEGRR